MRYVLVASAFRRKIRSWLAAAIGALLLHPAAPSVRVVFGADGTAPRQSLGTIAFPETFAGAGAAGGDGEIRLTYRQLTQLIEDAIRSLK